MSDNALVVSLVRAHLMKDSEYMSYVPHYRKVRWSKRDAKYVVEVIGGHWRRLAHAKRSIDALACVCKQSDLAQPGPYEPLVGKRRRNRI